MTPKEAIKRIKNHNEIHCRAEKHFAIHITEALNMAVEALEKQIPKKPKHEHPDKHRCTCPICMSVVDTFKETNNGRNETRVIPDYCPHCGQALDV